MEINASIFFYFKDIFIGDSFDEMNQNFPFVSTLHTKNVLKNYWNERFQVPFFFHEDITNVIIINFIRQDVL